MTSEQSKGQSAPTATEHPYPPPVQFPHFNGAPYPPPPPGYPPFFAYPAPPDGQQPEGANGALLPPYPMMYPPGMVYYPPPHSFVAPPTAAPAPAAVSRPKRKQVKMACTNCAAACKRCDEARPCERCQKYGIADSCIDGQRKERKKGIKRGPYKRKNKSGDANYDYQQSPAAEAGEWPQGAPPPSAVTTAAAMHAVAQLPSPPEGYLPIFLPPGYPLPDGQPGADGTNGHPPGPTLMPFYMTYSYPPFPLPPQGTHPPPLPNAQPVTAEAGSVPPAAKSPDEPPAASEPTSVNPAVVNDNSSAKGRKSSGKTDSKAKKATGASGDAGASDSGPSHDT